MLSRAEVDFLRDLHGQRRRNSAAQRNRRRGIVLTTSSPLFSAAVSFPATRCWQDGKRQILNLRLPRRLHRLSVLPSFEVAVNSVSSLTDVEVCPLPFGNLLDLFVRFPRAGTALFWSTACETAMYGEHLVDIGRRSACRATSAHLILELQVRLRAAGLADELSYTLPLTQELMADVLGLSGPHINRMIRCLRDEGLVTIDGHQVVIP